MSKVPPKLSDISAGGTESMVSVADEERQLLTEGDASAATTRHSRRACLLRVVLTLVVVAVIATAVAVAASNAHSNSSSEPIPAVVVPGCQHPVFCIGPLLEAVQSSTIFADSKTFVDMPIVNISSAQALMVEFGRVQPTLIIDGAASPLSSRRGTIPIYNTSLLREFVEQYFAPAGSDLTYATPTDWVPFPTALNSSKIIADEKLKVFALSINDAWKELVRAYVNRSEYCSDCQSSIPLPHNFVVPGGRFREFYYWDTYWILKGLLLSGMYDTAKGTLHNFFSMVDSYGFIPNGARLYFLDRSQPPLLAEMVHLVYSYTNDTAMVKEAMPRLIREHRFWLETDHLVNVDRDFSEKAKGMFPAGVLSNALLNRYYAGTTEPRPESWREDIATSADAPTRDPSDLFSNLAAGAETGWDYSSRWLNNTHNTFYPPMEGTNPLNNPNYNNLSTILTRELIPVDLNVILLRSEEIIASYLYGNWANQDATERGLFSASNGVVFDTVLAKAVPELADRATCAQFAMYAKRRRDAIQDILFDTLTRVYSDFNMVSGEHVTSVSNAGGYSHFYASSMLPYSVQTIVHNKLTELDIASFLDGFSAFVDVGGVPTSNVSVNATTGNRQQWDYPNGWAPMQFWAADALNLISRETSMPLANQASALRKRIVSTWMNNNYCGYQTPQTLPNGKEVHSLVEKYAVNQDKGVSGHGGEYTVQIGFGWTNGVALSFLVEDGKWLVAPASC